MCRQSVGGDMKRSDVERLGASGLLSQFMTEHLRLERDNPTFVTRAELLSSGVDLEAKRDVRPKQPAGTFIIHKQLAEAQRKALGLPPLSRPEYVALLRAIADDFQKLDSETYLDLLDTARIQHDRKSEDWHDGMHKPQIRDYGFLKNIVSEHGGRKEPYSTELFVQQIKRVVGSKYGRDQYTGCPGLTAYS